ncbi:dihydroorotase [Xylanibacter ruminicola]|uniref:dihydroorotase n=1 Tax=Xylanibacter ruminicola TaxID=839 RepID=UPI00048F6A2B|nr:dihydroorotase [Xylanibacter ruminicola]
MKRLILHGTLVNDANKFDGSVIVEDSKITKIVEGNTVPNASFDEVIDASGCFVLPGLIDDHVHFREPGLTAKADIDSESRAAAAGGVTTYFDMPNCVPQTTTLEALDEKFKLAAQKSHVNYSFFFGASNNNVDLFSQLDVHRIPGIKLFMGSSTGNMLVDRREALEKIFSTAQMPIMVHCEDTDIINRNMAEAKRLYGDDPKVTHHPEIRSVEACYQSTKLAVELALKHHAQLHIAHLTTAKELELLTDGVTAEVTPSHLYFCDRDYNALGTRIKCNPAIKSAADRDALRQAAADGRIAVIGTDHAPHLLEQKEGGCCKAASGMPMLQFSLVTMLELVDKGVLTIERLVELMCHRPADLFGVRNRGYLREGYQADIVIVRPNAAWTLTKDVIQSKCGWSPMENHTFLWRVEQTLCNGHTVYKDGVVDTNYIGQPVQFR